MNRTPVISRRRRHGLADVLADILIDYPIRMGLRTWFVMLALGAVHHDVLPWVPALGFVHTFLVLWLIDGLLTTPVFFGVKYGMKAADE